MDNVDPATRSRMMSRIRSTDTQPELAVRRFLHAHGFRFRVHTTGLPGRPDIVLRKWHTAIFVHGCYWHRHPGCEKTTSPSTNVRTWADKFSANVARDAKALDGLRVQGWNVIVIWECGIGKKGDVSGLGWLPEAIKHPTALRFVEWPIKTGNVRS